MNQAAYRSMARVEVARLRALSAKVEREEWVRKQIEESDRYKAACARALGMVKAGQYRTQTAALKALGWEEVEGSKMFHFVGGRE